jgi:DHA1 family tetracycline resistance protein-like MFS transporter
MVLVMGLFFFSTSVYPAIWTFWGIAKFGWSEAMVGATLAVFGLIAGGFQGLLTGPATKRFGEWTVALFGLVCATLVVLGYGFVGSLGAVIALMILHGPEGFVHPLMTSLLTKRVPEDAQGELQGGISAVTNVAMLFGTVFFAFIFGHFWAEDRVWRSTDVAYWVAAGFLAVTTFLFLVLKRSEKA